MAGILDGSSEGLRIPDHFRPFRDRFPFPWDRLLRLRDHLLRPRDHLLCCGTLRMTMRRAVDRARPHQGSQEARLRLTSLISLTSLTYPSRQQEPLEAA